MVRSVNEQGMILPDIEHAMVKAERDLSDTLEFLQDHRKGPTSSSNSSVVSSTCGDVSELRHSLAMADEEFWASQLGNATSVKACQYPETLQCDEPRLHLASRLPWTREVSDSSSVVPQRVESVDSNESSETSESERIGSPRTMTVVDETNMMLGLGRESVEVAFTYGDDSVELDESCDDLDDDEDDLDYDKDPSHPSFDNSKGKVDEPAAIDQRHQVASHPVCSSAHSNESQPAREDVQAGGNHSSSFHIPPSTVVGPAAICQTKQVTGSSATSGAHSKQSQSVRGENELEPMGSQTGEQASLEVVHAQEQLDLTANHDSGEAVGNKETSTSDHGAMPEIARFESLEIDDSATQVRKPSEDSFLQVVMSVLVNMKLLPATEEEVKDGHDFRAY